MGQSLPGEKLVGSEVSDVLVVVYAEFAAPDKVSRNFIAPVAPCGRRIAVQYVVAEVTLPDAEQLLHPDCGEAMLHGAIFADGFDAEFVYSLIWTVEAAFVLSR